MDPRTGQRPAITVIACLAWTLGWLLLVVRWRIAPVAWEFAWPGPAAVLAVGWGWLLIPTAAVCGWRVGVWPRSWPLALWPAAPLVLAWWGLPWQGQPGPNGWLAGAAILALAFLLHRSVRRHTPPPTLRAGWLTGRTWRAVHALALALAVVLLIRADTAAVITSCLLYPLYALFQLTLLLALPWPWLLQVVGRRHRPAVVLAGGLFALVHWPNPAVMLLTGLGMLFWAHGHRHGRPLAALSLSMGLLATLAAQGLPAAWTWHMQVGPAAVHQQAVPALAARYRDQVKATQAGALPAGAFLAALYPPTVGRLLPRDEAARWGQTVEFERRCQLAWTMLKTDEARRRRQGDVPPTTDPALHWTDAPAPWPERIRAHARSLPATASWAEVLGHSYRQLLGRPASPAELELWDPDLSGLQYQALTRFLLTHHRQLARAPFDTLASEELRFWR